MQRGNLGRNSIVLLASTWGHTALGLAASVAIARVLGPTAIGAIALNLGLSGLVMAALLPGFSQAHVKRLAEGQDAGRCMGTMTAIQLLLAGAIVVVLGALWAAGVRAASPELTGVFAFMLGSQVAGRVSESALKVFIVREWVGAHAAVLVGARAARLVATLAVLVWAPSIALVAATFCIEGVLATVAGAIVLARRYGVRMRMPDRATVGAYWTYARPFLVTTPIALVQDSIDRFLVGRWAGLEAAGHYHVARGMWELVSGVMAPPGLLLFTRLSSLYADRSAERDRQARELFFRGLDKLLFVTTPLAIGVWALAEPIVTVLYGASFAPAVTAVRILLLASLAANIVNPYTYVLHAQDEVARFIPVNILRLVVYLVALALLVPPSTAWAAWLSGDAGAALARLLLILFPAWVYFRWTRELAGIPFYRRAWVYLVGFAGAILVHEAAVAVAISLGLGDSVRLVLGATVAAAAYALYLARAHPDAAQNTRYALELLGLKLRPPARAPR